MGELTVAKLKKYARGDTLVETGTELQILDAIHKINPNYKITFINGYEDQHPNDILVASVG